MKFKPARGIMRGIHSSVRRMAHAGRGMPTGAGRCAASMLHFAYGSNMSEALMRARCPDATALGTAALRGWRFVIVTQGFGSIVPHPGGVVHGVLWRLSPRDLAAINVYENLDAGLYTRRILALRHGERLRPALVYVASRRGKGTPRPGYMDTVIEAARAWRLPQRYIRSLRRWAPSRWRGARIRYSGEIA